MVDQDDLLGRRTASGYASSLARGNAVTIASAARLIAAPRWRSRLGSRRASGTLIEIAPIGRPDGPTSAAPKHETPICVSPCSAAQPRVTVTASSVEQLFGDVATPFFQAHRVRLAGSWPLGAGSFRIVIVLTGQGELSGRFGRDSVTGGETWLLPAAVDAAELEGELELVVCLPGA